MRKLFSLFLIYIFFFPMLAQTVVGMHVGPDAAQALLFGSKSGTTNVSSSQTETSIAQFSDSDGGLSRDNAAEFANASVPQATKSKAESGDPTGTQTPDITAKFTDASGRQTSGYQAEFAGTGGIQSGTINQQLPLQVPQRNELVCDSSELSPNETQNIIDLLKKGFTVDANKGIVGASALNKDRDKLANNELVIQDVQDEN